MMSGEGVEGLRTMILSFRISELHSLLAFTGKNKSGNKTMLQARAMELATSGDPATRAKVQELYRQVQEVQPGPGPAIASFLGQGPSAPANPARPLQAAGVALTKLPFYTVHGQLVPPTTLAAQGSGRFQEAHLQFQLSCQQATDIASNRDTSPGSKLEYPYQVQVRFCHLSTSGEQGDEFPPSVCLQINDKMFPLPNPVPGKANTEPRRPPKPLDVSKLVKLAPGLANKVGVKWAQDSGRGWVVAVGLVEKLSSATLLERLIQKGTRNSEFTKELIRKKLSDDEDGIATTNIKVTLACPLGKMRMAAPCRPTTCDHLQCFDAHLFIQMNERKPTWQCPVCDGAATYDTLMVDGYFLDVISSPELPEEEQEIILSQDGSWHPVPRSEDAERIAREEREREVAGLPAGSDDESGGKPGTPRPGTPAHAKEIDCIDIDSD